MLQSNEFTFEQDVMKLLVVEDEKKLLSTFVKVLLVKATQ